MATKKKAAKKAVKKAVKKAAAPQNLSIKLSAGHKAKADACIKKNGKVTFRIKEVSVTRVPSVISTSVIMD